MRQHLSDTVHPTIAARSQDGIDISSSRDAVIRNIFINNSDDGVCMNSGAEEYGMNMAI
eukprot:COSAG02_NODE_66619_length_255_cov_0.602564_2_plen_58_part_01